MKDPMKAAIFYTVFSLANLIGFAAGLAVLPAQVPIHFNVHLIADRIGSPWIYLALPGAAALISAGIWAALLQKKNRAVTMGFLTASGIIFATIGWVFFALIASGVQIGERTDLPFAVIIGLPLSLLFAWLGIVLPRIKPNRVIGIRTHATTKNEEIWRRTHRFGGYLFLAAGTLSAVVTLIFGTVHALGRLQYIALIVMAVSVLIAAAAAILYAHLLWKRRPPAEEEQ